MGHLKPDDKNTNKEELFYLGDAKVRLDQIQKLFQETGDLSSRPKKVGGRTSKLR